MASRISNLLRRLNAQAASPVHRYYTTIALARHFGVGPTAFLVAMKAAGVVSQHRIGAEVLWPTDQLQQVCDAMAPIVQAEQRRRARE